ncbi:hypothetical protein E1181_22170 [Saccharopolyspora terrae]|uniref:Uncharacterized protein n=1 Tax=Saccharopolyspora terrae TaxID=2530384 RepID=A0A4R4VK87_9PSEU|nr:hypothetical protein [Saccharopolyspora terrae]TDD02694.1 hypothetical protein E1181_22170 [Saccharopolyspora terrae]
MIEVLAVRQQWCRRGESILWCHSTQLSCGFDVEGLDSRGKPKSEKLRSYNGGDRTAAHLGGVIGEYKAPMTPLGPVARTLDVDFSNALLPSAPVREGRIHGDEWVHDPTIRGWVLAESSNCDAVACANQLVAAGTEGWFIETDLRIAVVVEETVVSKSDIDEGEGKAAGLGGLLGKARSAVSTVAESLHGGDSLVTLWEYQCDQLADITEVRRGRWSESLYAIVGRFRDGSVIELKRDRDLPGI